MSDRPKPVSSVPEGPEPTTPFIVNGQQKVGPHHYWRVDTNPYLGKGRIGIDLLLNPTALCADRATADRIARLLNEDEARHV